MVNVAPMSHKQFIQARLAYSDERSVFKHNG